jgi:hypothetical protein
MTNTKDMTTLKAQRESISWRCDSDGAFPGSKKWTAANLAIKELQAFDAAHPEVIAEIHAEHKARIGEANPWT